MQAASFLDLTAPNSTALFFPLLRILGDVCCVDAIQLPFGFLHAGSGAASTSADKVPCFSISRSRRARMVLLSCFPSACSAHTLATRLPPMGIAPSLDCFNFCTQELARGRCPVRVLGSCIWSLHPNPYTFSSGFGAAGIARHQVQISRPRRSPQTPAIAFTLALGNASHAWCPAPTAQGLSWAYIKNLCSSKTWAAAVPLLSAGQVRVQCLVSGLIVVLLRG